MSVVDRTTTEAMDAAMMARCIELSKTSKQVGEFPFACVIAKDGKVVVETLNRVARDGDVTRHAEIVAIGMAQKALGTKDLSGCTLYTNVEPCVMCSFPMRETRISRVVYSIGSRLMGGDSKWDILADPELSQGDAGGVRRGARGRARLHAARGRESMARLEPADLGRDPLSRLLRSATQGRAGDARRAAPPQHPAEAVRAARLSSPELT